MPDIRTQQPFCLVNTVKKMIQSERFLPPWESFNTICSDLDHTVVHDPEMDLLLGDALDFSTSFTSPEESSVISSNSHVQTMFSGEFFDLPNLRDEVLVNSPMDELETFSTREFSEIYGWINENDYEGKFSTAVPMEGEVYSPCFSLESSENSMVFPLMKESNPSPGGMEIDSELSIRHLVKAYGEAIENGQTELAQVIVNSIKEKSNPLGKTMERLAFYLFLLGENQGDYLRHESAKNFREAFKAFYQGLPYGKFAHFVANSAILDSIPDDAATLHIVDFDIGEGIQWPPLIEAISRTHKELKFTLIKTDDECSCPCWDVEGTQKGLQDYAREYGLKLHIEEKSVSNIASELIRTKKREQGREWLVFNCMFKLPHMARRIRRSHVTEFLKIAKEILTNYEAPAGMVTLGYGETEIFSNTCSVYSSFFNELLTHYQALLESLEYSFPIHLAAARTALESLFLAPCMSSLPSLQDWEELTERPACQSETGLECRKLSRESLVEARQIVNERQDLYNVQIKGQRENEMVLEWKGTPMVRISTWM